MSNLNCLKMSLKELPGRMDPFFHVVVCSQSQVAL